MHVSMMEQTYPQTQFIHENSYGNKQVTEVQALCQSKGVDKIHSG